MIYLELFDGQGLGNQLWNYIALRSISKKLGFGYKVINPDKFKGKDFLDISYSNLGRSKDFEINRKGTLPVNIFNETIYFDNELNTFSSDFDSEILNIQSNTILRGLFQSENYLFNNDINEFIKIKEEKLNKIKSQNNICFLNIRGGEYKRFKSLILPKSYWINAMINMKKINKNFRFCIITDDYNYAKNLLPGLEIIKGNISEDFSQLFLAKYLIVSNSSFSYFPINLGTRPKKIIAPSNWSRFGNNQDRWVSPANYYKNWIYQNNKGDLLSNETVEEKIKKTRLLYSTYNVQTTKESLTKNNLSNFIPMNLKKILKKILSRLFPLLIG